MIEIILSFVIGALLVYIGAKERLVSQERSKLINALMAKSAYEQAAMDVADKTRPTPTVKTPELTPVENLTDEQFEKIINEEI